MYIYKNGLAFRTQIMAQAIKIKVRGFHLDVFSHVNNARYLEFLEEARWAIYEKAIGEMYQKGYTFGIVNININYRKPAFLSQELLIDAQVSKIGEKSFTISQKITLANDGSLVADADVICVIIDTKLGKSVLLANEMADLVKAMENDEHD